MLTLEEMINRKSTISLVTLALIAVIVIANLVIIYSYIVLKTYLEKKKLSYMLNIRIRNIELLIKYFSKYTTDLIIKEFEEKQLDFENNFKMEYIKRISDILGHIEKSFNKVSDIKTSISLRNVTLSFKPNYFSIINSLFIKLYIKKLNITYSTYKVLTVKIPLRYLIIKRVYSALSGILLNCSNYSDLFSLLNNRSQFVNILKRLTGASGLSIILDITLHYNCTIVIKCGIADDYYRTFVNNTRVFIFFRKMFLTSLGNCSSITDSHLHYLFKM